ncbi:MAG: Aldose 1-epimerase [Pseudonocardiales bacterium]|nr:Aldose 1-epimerase [Pseudonocardiales bacterium]
MALTGRQFTIAAGDHEATVVEVGAGLRRYAVGGDDVTVTYGDDDLPPKGCGAVLVPWPNRLRGGRYAFDGQTLQVSLTDPATGNANHGLGRWARWVAVAQEPSEVTLALDIVPQTGWPFEVRVEVTYAVHAEFGLGVTAVARNTGSRSAPFGAGFHPYLSTRGRALSEVRLRVPAQERLMVDDAQIPVGNKAVARTTYDLRRGRRLRELRLDDAFTELTMSDGRAAVDVRTPAGGGRVWFDEAFRYVQVFTPEIVAGGRPGIAVEPMTCPADAFNSGIGLLVLEPGATWTGSWGIQPL